jgi:hypothetical protein
MTTIWIAQSVTQHTLSKYFNKLNNPMPNSKKAQSESASQQKFINSVTKNKRWRGVSATTADAGKVAGRQFKRLTNHNQRNQPAVIIIETKKGDKINKGFNKNYNQYKPQEKKGSQIYQSRLDGPQKKKNKKSKAEKMVNKTLKKLALA